MTNETPAIDKDIVKQVAKAAGWMQFKAKRELTEAAKLGITPKQYLNRKCWNLDASEIKDLGERLERQRALKEEQAAELSELTGWSTKESARKIREAKHAGLTFKQYINRHGYELPSEDLHRLAVALEATKRRRSDNREYMIDMIVEKSGWTRPYVNEQLDAAKEKGINVFNYFSNSCWNMDEDELEACSKMCQGFHENSEGKREKCQAYIVEQTGWNEGELILHTLETLADSGCSTEDFARCHMWDMDLAQQRTFLNSTIFRKFRIANDDFETGSSIFDYKDTFEEVFAKQIHRRHFAFDEMSKGDFFNAIKGLSHVVVKPARGSYGRDIEILPCNVSYLDNGKLYQHLIDIGKPLVIEEKIEQCAVLDELCPTSVNTLRVVTLVEDGHINVLQCVLRCGVGAIVDNIHSGGLVCEVDPETGVCQGDAVDYFGNLIEKHPVTDVSFKGLQVPNMDSVLALAEEAAMVVPECKLIGWDIAVTPDGADLVEGNLKADYDAGQMAHLGVAREGLRDTMVAPYVHPSLLGHSYLEDIAKEEDDAEAISENAIKFSVVMPVYNAQDYLHDSLDAIIGQNIGFSENIQVVLVDDGSTDDSARICKEYAEQYPDNIIFIDKKNGGPSSARNAGIPHAKGAYINFADPDDVWDESAFANAWKFLAKHKGEIDVVGCRQKLFGTKSGYHQLDYKFKEPDRIVSIWERPDFIQMSVASAFIARDAMSGLTFDERISIGEDAKLLTDIILEKCRYGILRSAVYNVRKREDSTSVTQNKNQDKSTFLNTIKYYYRYIADRSKADYGRIIPYVQHCLVNGLKYRAGKPIPEVLTFHEGVEYRKEVIDLISQIDDGVLLDAKNANPSLKMYMMHLKNELPMKGIAYIEDGGVWVNGGKALEITGNGNVRIDDIKILDDSFELEGTARIPGFIDSYGLFCEVGGDIKEIALNNGDILAKDDSVEEKIGITDEEISRTVPFSVEFPPCEGTFEIKMFSSYNDDVICIPIAISQDGPLAGAKKGEVRVGPYQVSRPDRHVLKVKKDAS